MVYFIMKLKEFLKDKLIYIILFLFSYLLIFLLFITFKIDRSLIIAISLIFLFLLILILTIDYLKKKTFYANLFNNMKNLDKPYLVLETIEEPSFYEGNLLYQALYEINKKVIEIIKLQERAILDFKEYIEMWIHEIKIPMQTLSLMKHNHQELFNKKAINQLKSIDDYVEQILYYVRSENSEKDYLIKRSSLEKIIGNVALKNKDVLLESKIDLIVLNLNVYVYTDAKWLEFILNQIINNNVKYKKDNNSYIKIYVEENNNEIVLNILDNGMGINDRDLKKVFEKTFTGTNGRIKAKSTGMGLYIAKNLCTKLGSSINIKSKENEYTNVSITFYKNNYYDVVR